MFFQVVFLALLALLPMVNPPTTATLLLGLSKGMSREHIRRQINMAALYLFATLCVSFFIGSSILDLFGISIPGLRLAGGLIIAFIGFRMLFPSPNQSAGVEANQNIAFVPLTMPSMCGPGTMALVISGAAQIAELPAEADRVVIYAAMVTAFALMSLISWGVLKLADPVCKILGATGSHRRHDPHHGFPAGVHGYAVLHQRRQGGGAGSRLPWSGDGTTRCRLAVPCRIYRPRSSRRAAPALIENGVIFRANPS